MTEIKDVKVYDLEECIIASGYAMRLDKYNYPDEKADNLNKHIANVGGDTDNYKLKTTRSLKIASTNDYFYAVMKANHINPNKYVKDISDDVTEK